MLKYTLEKSHTSVIHVVKPSFKLADLINMLKYILERNHTSVIHVVKPLFKLAD